MTDNWTYDYSFLDELYEQVRRVYLDPSRPFPWVIGYSGGKDSTATLQVVWTALEQLPPEQRTKAVHVISTNTLVESPVIDQHVSETLEKIEMQAQQAGMPFKTHRLQPLLGDSFWVNLIGRGYPTPSNIFRWCTDRLKIQPSNRFILEQVNQNGEVILALGMRKSESQRRDRVIKEYDFRGYSLARHGQLAGAWIYMPIENFSTEEVWGYLLDIPSPWGSDNRELYKIYRSSAGGDCPLVIDDTTPSCGNSRFGCWVCTVVDRDRSMESMIDSGEQWMAPLLEFRDWLAATQDPEVKPEQREYKGRDGRIKITSEGKLRWRTYTLEFSQKMIRKLLETQSTIKAIVPDFELLSDEELREIRRLWIIERRDWEDTLPGILLETTGRKLHWEKEEINIPGRLEREILSRHAETENVPLALLQKLIDAEWQHYGMFRRSQIHAMIEKIFNEDWRTLGEVEAVMRERQLSLLETAEDS